MPIASRYLSSVVLLTVTFTAGALGGTRDLNEGRSQLASDLTAERILSQYGRYYASGAGTRLLAARVENRIQQVASDKQLRLPVRLTPADQRFVHRMLALPGDDFDVAYNCAAQRWLTHFSDGSFTP